MLRELTKENFSDSEPVQHPKFPFVYFSGKKYFCQEHPNLRMNGGTIKQHIRGPQHRLNYETAEPLSKQDDPFVNLPHKQKDFDIESFLNRKKNIRVFFSRVSLLGQRYSS